VDAEHGPIPAIKLCLARVTPRPDWRYVVFANGVEVTMTTGSAWFPGGDAVNTGRSYPPGQLPPSRVDMSESTPPALGERVEIRAAWWPRWRRRGRRSGPPPAGSRAVVVLGAGSTGWTGAGILRADALAQTATDAGSGDGAGDGRARCVCRRSSSVGKGLARGPAEVLGTLLQEAAHAPAHVRAVKETSRQGRW
jgi:hypothetical protein